MGFKGARERAGLTVIQAKNALGVSSVAVYQWENGEYLPESKRLMEIARLYGCTVDELLENKNTPPCCGEKGENNVKM